MVSANPDKLLAEAFTNYRLPLQFDYFSANNKEEKYKIRTLIAPCYTTSVALWKMKNRSSSTTTTFFCKSKPCLRGPKCLMPTEVQSVLQKASTYIFLGFHFERWQTQLFLRYLNMLDKFTNNSRNYASKPPDFAQDTEFFLQNQFNVNFIEADFGMLAEIFRQYAAKSDEAPIAYPLRSLVDTLSASGQAMLQLVERDDLPAAFAMLHVFAPRMDKDWSDLLTTTEGEYNRLQREREALTVLEYNPRMAFICNNLIELAKKLP